MFKGSALFITILMACLILGNCDDAVELADVQNANENTSPVETGALTQLRFKASNSTDDLINYYKCTFGNQIKGRFTCIPNDRNSFGWPQNVELKIRCPNSGPGAIVSYVEIDFSVSSDKVNCRIHEGGIGLRYIGVTLQAWNTYIFNYSAKFYGY